MIIADLVQPLNDAIFSVGLSLPRLLTCFLIVPLLSGRNLHGLLRIAVGMGIGIPVAVSIFYQQATYDLSIWQMVALYIKEAAIGLLLGFLLAIPFWVFESIGTLFDTQRGALMGQQLNPETGSMTSITGTLLFQCAVVLMIEVGAFVWLFGFIMDSFYLWPPLVSLPDFSQGAESIIVEGFSGMAAKFVIYSLPLLLTLAFIELIFALIGVYSPQLQVYFMAMPAKSLLGMMVLVLYAGILWRYGAADFEYMKEAQHLLIQIAPAYFEVQ